MKIKLTHTDPCSETSNVRYFNGRGELYTYLTRAKRGIGYMQDVLLWHDTGAIEPRTIQNDRWEAVEPCGSNQ